MITKVALIAQVSPGLQRVHEQLRNPVKYIVREFLSLEEINQNFTVSSFDVILMRVQGFSEKHVQMLERVRARFPEVGLVTSAQDIDPTARFQARAIRQHKLIHEANELGDLCQVIDVVKRGAASAQRLHPRVRREGEAEIVNPETGQRMQAQFCDFAQMGARLTVKVRAPLQKRARVQLHYRSSHDPKHFHRIEAMVVWGGVTSGIFESIVSGPQQMVGLRFIAAL